MSRRVLALPALAALVVALAGCGASTADSTARSAGSTAPEASSDAPSGFPVTIDSALGSVTLERAPERVVTWGWSTQDAVLALGVVPVAMPEYTYGGGETGVLPWDERAIAALGGETPTLLPGADAGEIPYEQIAAAKPDVILAPYSGLTADEYATLSALAPTVAYPDQPWATTWQEQTRIVGEALGRADEAEALIEATDADVAALGAANPVLTGKTFMYGAPLAADQLNVYRADDPRVELLVQLGMVVAPSVAELDAKPDEGTYFYPLSYEKLSEIDADVLVAYFDSEASEEAFTADPLVAAMPQVAGGRFAPIVGESFVMASSAPTVLSIPWMLDDYVPRLTDAAAKVG